jgi:hypothetical protein
VRRFQKAATNGTLLLKSRSLSTRTKFQTGGCGESTWFKRYLHSLLTVCAGEKDGIGSKILAFFLFHRCYLVFIFRNQALSPWDRTLQRARVETSTEFEKYLYSFSSVGYWLILRFSGNSGVAFGNWRLARLSYPRCLVAQDLSGYVGSCQARVLLHRFRDVLV